MRATWQRFCYLCLAAIAVLVLISAAPPAQAAKTEQAASKQKPSDISGAVTQTYTADAGVQIGMIVALKEQDSKVVVPLSKDKLSALLGVVIPTNQAAIVLTPEKVEQQQVLVATSGRYGVIVSNQNGPIKVGDYVAVSAVKGIGMKAGEDDEQIIGKAAGQFSGTANVIGSAKLKDSTGKESNVSFGIIPVDIRIGHNPLFFQAADYVPGFLAKAANTVADKPVSVARIYLSLAILLIISVITGNILYSGVKNGMRAVGRNPLSKKSIIRSLIQTVIAGLIIFAAGVFAVYLLLKL